MVATDDFYMSLAINEAWKRQGLTYPNPVVGALILDKHGKILSIAATQKAGDDHAELHAICQALISLGDTKLKDIDTATKRYRYVESYHDNRLQDASIYVTLEPCTHHGKTPPCASLIQTVGFAQLFCGTTDPHELASGGLELLKEAGLDVHYGIQEEACKTLLYPFLKWQANEPFVFYKVALCANGVYDGGIITSKASRTHVHALRDNCDLLVIGGESVRQDRPTLDSRLVSGKAPDILILSRQKEWDQTIPLFSVKNRKVFIEESLDRIKDYRFVMIEGTEKMWKASETYVDWYCIFVAPHMRSGKTLQFNKALKPLHHQNIEEDTLGWYISKKETL